MNKRIPANRHARQQLIVDLLRTHSITSQGHLVELLAEHGFDVTQATVSRDLEDVGAIKRSGADGVVYSLPGSAGAQTPESRMDRLTKVMQDLLLSVDSSGPIVVLRTPPGAASYVASALDEGVLEQVIGTVAGDDTVFVIANESYGSQRLAEVLLDLAAGMRPSSLASS